MSEAVVKTSDVVVVGAGPVGLVLAYLLGRRGLSVIVIERNEAIVTELRASTFHPPTLDLLEGVGISLVEQGLVSPTWQVRDHASGDAAVFDMAILRDETGHPYRLQCEQHKLSHTVLAAIKTTLPNVEVLFDKPVAAVFQDEDGAVARCEDGESVRGTYLVGCDGARSLVRAAIGQTLSGKTYPETMILATTRFDFAAAMPNLSNVNYVWTSHPDLTETFSLLRVPGRWRASLYPLPGESEEEALSTASIERKMQAVFPRDEPYEVLERRAYRIHQRIVERYFEGRIVLCGDSAHVNSPSGGMGLNGGVHDAFCLAEKLPDLVAGAGPELLERYQRQRRPIAEEQILKQADANRARMRETDPTRRRALLDELKAIAADPQRLKERLMTTSMIAGLRQSSAVA
ncbi:MAG: FAD-dependent oxidoreductase [Salinarimonas sp.]